MYIGIADEPAKIRWANGKGYKDNPVFWECICSVGWENITHEIVATGLDSWEARKLESELIDLYGTLIPTGFNRRLDGGGGCSCYRKMDFGITYGHATVVDYWPDSEGKREYEMRCECGRFFRCRWDEITDELSCGECET
jgi:hypothetical protein